MTTTAAGIAARLVREALASGLLDVTPDICGKHPGSGSTAMEVARLETRIPFVVKIDTEEKLAKEGKVLRRLQDRDDLLPEFKACFPRIFALIDIEPVYAYLMEAFRLEDGFHNVKETLFPPAEPASTASAVRVTNAACDALFGAYASSRNTRLRPSIYADYVERICSRLETAGEADERFASRPVEVISHGCLYEPWEKSLNELQEHKDQLERLVPPFVTFVHGDPNPENILIRSGVSGVEIRLIDPKEWQDGDYLFDITKFAHYIAVTGPMQQLGPEGATAQIQDDGRVTIDHQIDPPIWLPAVMDTLRSRTAEFADVHHDSHWDLRFKLGMASNLLGLPANRLARKETALALATYAEGLLWLNEALSAMQQATW